MSVDFDDIAPLKGLRIVCHNVRSLNDETLTEFKRLLVPFDIGMVVETWLEPEIDLDGTYEIPMYNCLRIDRKPHVDKTGGGLLLYVNRTFER